MEQGRGGGKGYRTHWLTLDSVTRLVREVNDQRLRESSSSTAPEWQLDFRKHIIDKKRDHCTLHLATPPLLI